MTSRTRGAVLGGIVMLGVAMLVMAGLRVEIAVSDRHMRDAGRATRTRAFALEVVVQRPWHSSERGEAGVR